jgi:hypothetical protein
MTEPTVDPEALLCALVLAPRTFPRNRFFEMYEDLRARRAWRRASRIRGMVRQLSGTSNHSAAEVVGEQVLDDGRVMLRYCVPDLGFTRTTALSPLEASLLRYALHRARQGPLDAADQRRVHEALRRLGRGLTLAGEPLLDEASLEDRPSEA